MHILLATPNAELADLITRSFQRFHYQWTRVDNGAEAFQKAVTQKFDLMILDFNLPKIKALEILRRFRAVENYKIVPVIVLTTAEEERNQIEVGHFPQTEIVSKPFAMRQFVSLAQQILHEGIRVACLGGGTGLFTLLSGLKTISGLDLYSIVSMSDDGGSTGKLRDMFGILPPGDVRRSLVALSTAPDLLNELMQYRFDQGAGLEGHNIGNLLLTALAKMRGSMTHAVKSISEILNIQGHVIPVTETLNTLKAELENGAIIEGEHRIDLFEGNDPRLRIKRLWQEPQAEATPEALEALLNAKFIILGPGDLFTSIIPNLVVRGIPEAILASHAKKIYICNIMTKAGETTDFQVSDHVREIIRYLGKDVLDRVLCSSTHFSQAALDHYATQRQYPVQEKNADLLQKITKAGILWEDVASESVLVRHDSLKLATALKKIMEMNSHHH